MRSLLSLTELRSTEVAGILQRSAELLDEASRPRTLAGRRVGLYFRKTSTRTRTSFWAAAVALGADIVQFGPEDLQLVTGESVEDTGRVLASYLDVLVMRTNGDKEEMRRLATASGLAVVNALSIDEHPTQALCDLVTLAERFGSLAGRHVLYVGGGNSTAAALALAVSHVPGLRLTVVTPPAHGLPPAVLEAAARISGHEGRVEQCHELDGVRSPVDAVYTSRWLTMGVPNQDPAWRAEFEPYRVDRQLIARLGRNSTVFLHDLPAIRGEEVTDDVLDGECSLAWRQAFHKFTSAMAVLDWSVNGPCGQSR